MPLIQANDMGDEYMKIGFIKNKYMDSSFWSMIQYEPIFAQVEKVVLFCLFGEWNPSSIGNISSSSWTWWKCYQLHPGIMYVCHKNTAEV